MTISNPCLILQKLKRQNKGLHNVYFLNFMKLALDNFYNALFTLKSFLNSLLYIGAVFQCLSWIKFYSISTPNRLGIIVNPFNSIKRGPHTSHTHLETGKPEPIQKCLSIT